MNLEEIRKFCLALPYATEDVKWGNDLCFLIGGKMFCAVDLKGPFRVSFKVSEEEFATLTESLGVIPAPYLARYHWVLVQQQDRFTPEELTCYLRQSYRWVREKLPKKITRDWED